MAENKLARELLAGNKPNGPVASATPEQAPPPVAPAATPVTEPELPTTDTPPQQPVPEAPPSTTPPVEEGGAAPAPKDTPAPKPVTTPEAVAPAEIAPVALDDEAVIKYLKEKGHKVDSLDDLKPAAKVLTAEEQAAAAEEAEQQALQFGLSNKLFNKDELRQYHVDASKSSRDIVFDQFAKRQLALNAKLTPPEIEALFADLYFETEEEADPRRIAATAQMEESAAAYMKSAHSKVTGASGLYQQYKKDEQAATEYRRVVTNAASHVGEDLSFDIMRDGKPFTYKYKIPTEAIAAVQDQFLDKNNFAKLGESDMKEDVVQARFSAALQLRELQKIIAVVADGYAADVLAEAKMGRKGIPITTEVESGATLESKQPYQGQARERLKQATAA